MGVCKWGFNVFCRNEFKAYNEKKKKKIRDLELDLGKKSLELKVDTFWHMK